ncbi:MAG: TonB-dependent receptor [Pseudomonadota bacterium]
MEEIVVVGSSIGVSEAAIETQALPIDVLGEVDLQQSGAFNVGDIMKNQPAFSGFNGQNIGDGSSQQNLNLRGIGPQYSLSLVDGQRFSVNGPANVNMIPAAALKRVEVLKAGASSIYGSDAVAGVVNFVMKDYQDGAALGIRYGEADNWDFENYTFSYGAGDEDASFFFLADWYSNPELRGVDRFEFISNDRRPLGGFDGRSPNQNPAQILVPGQGSLILDYDRIGRGEFSLDPADYRPFDFERDAHDRADPCRDGGAECRGQTAYSETDQYTLLLSGKVKLGENTRLRGNIMHHEIETLFVGGVSTAFLQVPATNYWNPFGRTVFAQWRPFGGDRFNNVGALNEETLTASRGSFTLDHDLNDKFTLTVSGNAFSQEIDQDRPTAYLIEPLEASLALTGPESINVFCNFCNTDAQYEGIVRTRSFERDSELFTADARITGSLFSTNSGDVQVVAGLNWRSEEFQFKPDALVSAGAFLDTSPAQPEDLDRQVWAGFLEARIPLLGTVGAADDPRMELGLAVRYEDFDDVGSTTDPLISVKYQLIPDQLAFRGSWNTSFRAPPLENLAGAQSFAELRLVDNTLPGSPIVDVQGITGGNPDLAPEEAETLSLGLILTPTAIDGLRISVDWWQLEQTDLILAPQAQAVLDGLLPGNVFRGPGIGTGGENIIVETILINAGERNYEGIDAAINYNRMIADTFDLGISLATTYTLSVDATLTDGTVLDNLEGTANEVFGLTPQMRFLGTLSLGYGDFTASLQYNFIDEYDDLAADRFFGLEDVVIDSQAYVDVQASYAFEQGLGLISRAVVTLGIENITDEEPQFFPGGNDFDFSFNDIRQRMWYASLNVSF